MQSTLFEHNDTTVLENIDWGFQGATTDYLTHSLHTYPARMIPQIPSTLFNHWLSTDTLSPGDLVFDPFCGSGTTPVEARRFGLNAIATDINPFACLLSRTKATALDIEKLNAAIDRCCYGPNWFYREQFIDQEHQHQATTHGTKHGSDLDPDDNTTTPSLSVKRSWFPEPQVYKIEAMHRHLMELRAQYNYKIIRFIRIALSKAARKISYQRDGEFKRHRIPPEERESHNPAFTPLFASILEENKQQLQQYQTKIDPSTSVEIKYADCRDKDILDPNSVDAIVTSPPYGDHRTTVGYGQFSQAPAAAATPLDIETLKDVDPSGLGGRLSGSDLTFETVTNLSNTLEATITELNAVDGRDTDVLEFFTDYAQTLQQIARVIKPGQPVAIVVGNRTVSRIPIPTHLITTELALKFGLTHQATHPRSIPNKVLPFENAPENIPGNTGHTIADEYVLIFNGTDETSYTNTPCQPNQ
jgi:site-specific DNA-methyltransferase (cytosine-N4-specific)